MIPHRLGWPLAFVLLAFVLRTSSADDSANYLRDVKPILKSRCFACHGALKQESELRLDTGSLIRKGGFSGAAIVPGSPEKSLLLERVSAKAPAERMPPEGEPLTKEEIAKIRKWIKGGAPAPKNEKAEKDPRDHWAFRKPIRPAIPPFSPELGNAIDAFLLRELNAAGIAPADPAKKSVLLRRVTLDLTGLPPTREELHRFLADDEPGAYERVVDRLLASPRYGERWARHWMDIWRYSDWYGRRHVPDVWNSAPQIWRWRDWIVESLNNDHGYDRMVQEMLAADEIVPEDYRAGHATGYLIRNWYALNPNDWMRSNVEHTGKAFLGLTFNCAHCHDHKYDPISQDDYFRFRAFFEPIGIRQDRVPFEADPGPFQEYDYSTLRKIQRLGAVRIYDKNPKAPTWFYTGGDERNRVKERGSMPPGVPSLLTETSPNIESVSLPPTAWYPGFRDGIQRTVLAEAASSLEQAEENLAKVEREQSEPPAELENQLAKARRELKAAQNNAESGANTGAVEGRQSLVLDAVQGRRLVQNTVQNIKGLSEGTVLQFQFLILKDAHFNFQLAKDHLKGLTAAYVAFEKGRILSYRPGSFQEFEVGRYDFPSGQNRFLLTLGLFPARDECLLSIRSLSNDQTLVDQKKVALNGWNPVGDPTKAITLDARTGSKVLIDEITIRSPDSAADSESSVHFDFEPPTYADGNDIIGIKGWISSRFSQAPATSMVSSTAANASLAPLVEKVEEAERAINAFTLPIRSAKAAREANIAKRNSIQARIAADEARFANSDQSRAEAAAVKASLAERDFALKKAESEVLFAQLALEGAKSKPETDKNRASEIQSASKQLTSAKTSLSQAKADLAKPTTNEYTAFSPKFPDSSTGRRKALALWITNRENPLTARVAVNHIWMRHFHQPLVASVYDFGRNGKAPTHPDLLDWLSVELMESGWRMKHLHRLMVTSEAYRRSSSAKGCDRELAVDPENGLYWRRKSGRMEAEVVRDSLLACGGVLNLKMGGQELENPDALTTYRRSLYYSVHPEQGGRNEMGELFDAPSPLDCYRRTRSIVPQQALALTNSDLVHKLSARVVELADPATSDEAFITFAFERILSRQPSDRETDICLRAMSRQLALMQKSKPEAPKQRAREGLVRALFNHNDFLTIR